MPSIVHFDLPADDPTRARKFYSELFGWKFERYPGPEEYYLIETGYLEGQPGVRGGMGKRGSPDQKITNYIGVASIDEYLARVESLGGKVILPKMTVPGFGYLAVCLDTEGNSFGLWEEDPTAK
jgi:predicted enzyme related to lactoylglutathione lyase